MNLSISLDKNSEILYNFLLLPVQFEVYQNILKLRRWPLACTPYKAFFLKKKRNRGLELVSLPHFLHQFWRKTFLTLYVIKCPNFIAWLPLLLDMLGNICIVMKYFPVYDVINFKIDLIFHIKPFSYMTKIAKTKI